MLSIFSIIYLAIYLFIYLSFLVFIYPYFYLSILVCISSYLLSIYQFVYFFSIYIFIYLYIYLFSCFIIYFSIHLFFTLSIFSSILYLSIHLFIYLSIHLCISNAWYWSASRIVGIVDSLLTILWIKCFLSFYFTQIYRHSSPFFQHFYRKGYFQRMRLQRRIYVIYTVCFLMFNLDPRQLKTFLISLPNY